MLERCDDEGTAFYFSADDFPNLRVAEYPFYASAGHLLQGYLYSYDHADPNRLVVFEHGMGGGHQSYMKEIERLCRHGFRVFAYDHTGCMKSGGRSTNGFAQSLCDLNDCITALKADAGFSQCSLSVMGHSWGGYSAMNIVALHPEVSSVVAMCGFVSVREILDSYVGRWKKYSKMLLEYERKLNPLFVDYDAVNSLSQTKANVLLVYSDNDEKCKPIHYMRLKKGLEGKENIRFLMVSNKGHNPNYTERAVQILEDYANKRRKMKKRKRLETERQKKAFVSSFDWNAMTEQDETVWAEIFKALERENTVCI